ncbi:unnamed protein product [Linum tenue]|uniref:Uncharacterized protein n=1 Tax=Linum tenue TaxID=586396 RepID=A0AAV0P1L8_9ROSI|nr:unnamed protein product [Linum tenue]CAI0464273.1 unnamed protein product [Linum tenue]
MKQSPVGSRTKNSKGFKVKHVLQAFLLLVVSVWLIYQLKHSYDKKAALDENGHGGLPTEETEEEQEILFRLGRKDLIRPIVSSTETVNGNGVKGEMDDDMDEVKGDEIDEEGTHGGGSGGGDDEVDGRDQDRTDEEEPEEVEDLIDVDDRERDERTEDGKGDSNGGDHISISITGDDDEGKDMGRSRV